MGIAASIRIVSPQSLKKSDFVDGGTATEEMLDFLAECLRYGISTVSYTHLDVYKRQLHMSFFFSGNDVIINRWYLIQEAE